MSSTDASAGAGLLPAEPGRQEPRLRVSPETARWLRFAARRPVTFAVSMLVLLVASFALIHLIPGDPVRASVGIQAPASFVQQRREELHLEDPLYRQFVYYVRDAARFNFGTSISTGQPVSYIIS